MDIKLFRNGSKKIFEKIFQSYYRSLCLFANKIIDNMPVAEDIAQESFIALWGSASSIENENHLKAFLYQITKNNCLNYLKREKIKNRFTEVNKIEQIDREFSYMVIEEEIERIMRHMIETLPPKCSEIFMLAMKGKSNEEIANQLRISINTVKTQKKISYNRLREHISSLYSLLLFLC